MFREMLHSQKKAIASLMAPESLLFASPESEEAIWNQHDINWESMRRGQLRGLTFVDI